ncbi:MAG: hypothetical protein MSS98_04200 [Alphaproteobacteria bacterium]|nr:hypothetical protein [Alphaproteobacteria bacterium]MDY4690251.1 hypothetical protein [Alphaproteobacteria bacterium]
MLVLLSLLRVTALLLVLLSLLVEHKSEFPLVGDDPNGHYSLSGIIMAMNLVPET